MKILNFSFNGAVLKRSESIKNQNSSKHVAFSGKPNNLDKFLKQMQDESLKRVINNISPINGMDFALNKISMEGIETLVKAVKPHIELFMSAFRGNILTNSGENFRLHKAIDITEISSEKELLKSVSKLKAYFDRYKGFIKEGTRHFTYRIEYPNKSKYVREQIDFHDFNGVPLEIEGLSIPLKTNEPVLKTSIAKNEIDKIPEFLQKDLANSPDKFIFIGHRDLLKNQKFWADNL